MSVGTPSFRQGRVALPRPSRAPLSIGGGFDPRVPGRRPAAFPGNFNAPPRRAPLSPGGARGMASLGRKLVPWAALVPIAYGVWQSYYSQGEEQAYAGFRKVWSCSRAPAQPTHWRAESLAVVANPYCVRVAGQTYDGLSPLPPTPSAAQKAFSIRGYNVATNTTDVLEGYKRWPSTSTDPATPYKAYPPWIPDPVLPDATPLWPAAVPPNRPGLRPDHGPQPNRVRWTRPQTVGPYRPPGYTIDVAPDRVVVRPPAVSRPPPRVKEGGKPGNKLKGVLLGLGALAENATELMDFYEIIFDAAGITDGSFYSRFEAYFFNGGWKNTDWSQVPEGIVKNAVEDYVVGQGNNFDWSRSGNW